MTLQYKLRQPILLQQSPKWSRSITWGIVSITAFTVIWALVFQIDESIRVQGKLEPKAAVTDVQASVSGVVQKIHVKEGEPVKEGQILITLEQKTTSDEIKSLQTNLKSLVQEIEFYQSFLKGSTSPSIYSTFNDGTTLNIPPIITYLAKNRAALTSENQLYRAQLNGSTKTINLNPEQQLRLQSRQTELKTRLQQAQLEIGKIQQQFRQTQAQLIGAKKELSINKNILNRYEGLTKHGAFAEVETLKQRQNVASKQAQIEALTKEQQRLKLAIEQAEENLSNTDALSKENLLSQIANNDKKIAEIDSQFSKLIIENSKKINEIKSKLSSAETTLEYQKITSPSQGTVFELKPKTKGFVVNKSEPIMKIVPKDNLIAKVYITNSDIGFVKKQLEQKNCLDIDNKNDKNCPDVDIRFDTYPFQRYGDIKGKLIEIGSDALSPDQQYPFWRYPAKVRLNNQKLELGNSEISLPLQSGMSVNANIKLRKRNIMSIFTDFLIQKVESLKFIRR